MDNFTRSVKRHLVVFVAENKVAKTKWAKEVGISREAVRRWISFDCSSLPTLYGLSYLHKNYGLDINALLEQKGVNQ